MYELKDKENIEVEVQHVANDYTTVLKTKINAGEIPDVFMTGAGTDNVTYAEFSYDLSNEPIVDKFLDWALDFCRVGDKLVGLPANIQSYALIYNKKLFADAGITEIPKTLEELENVCEILADKGITPFSNGYKETWVVFQHQISPFIMAGGGTPDEIASKLTNGELTFDTMKYFNNYLDYIDLTVKYGLPKPLETGWEEQEVNLAVGKAAIMHMGEWCEPVLVKANPDVDVAFLPVPVSNDPNDARISSSVSSVLKVSSTSKNKDAAIKAIDYFLTSESGMNYTVVDSGWVLLLKDVPVEPDGMLVNSVNEILSDSSAYSWADTAWPDGFSEGGGKIIQAYIAGLKDRSEVGKELNDLWLELSSE